MRINRQLRGLLLAATILTYLLVTLGGIVCVTGASRGCPDWPACYGRLYPPPRLDSILEYTHRLLAGITSLTIIVTALVGWRRACRVRWVRWPPIIAIAFLIAVSVFGAMVVLRGLGPGLAALDLGSALVVLALLLASTTVAVHHHRHPQHPSHLAFRSPFARLALGTLVAVFVVFVSGVLVAQSGSAVRCLSWPLYGGPWILGDRRGWLQLARALLSGIAGILIAWAIVQAWRPSPQSRPVRWLATLSGLLLVVELLTGALGQALGAPLWLQVAYVAVAVALWAAIVTLAVLAGLESSRAGETSSHHPYSSDT